MLSSGVGNHPSHDLDWSRSCCPPNLAGQFQNPGYAESMRKIIFPLAMLFVCFGAAVSRAQTPRLDTDEQKTFYALGLLLGDNVKVFDLKAEELAIVKAGMTDAITGAKPQVDIDTFGPK